MVARTPAVRSRNVCTRARFALFNVCMWRCYYREIYTIIVSPDLSPFCNTIIDIGVNVFWFILVFVMRVYFHCADCDVIVFEPHAAFVPNSYMLALNTVRIVVTY